MEKTEAASSLTQANGAFIAGSAAPSVLRGALAAAWASRLLPPIAAFICARGVLSLAAWFVGVSPWSDRIWSHWDAGLYQQIAREGYTLNLCGPGSGYPAGSWCGTTAWFPGYPLIMSLLMKTGMTGTLAGAVVSASFELGTLIVLWNGFGGPRRMAAGFGWLLACALFPGVIFRHAAFPTSGFLFFACLAIHWLWRERPLAAGCAGFCAATMHSTSAGLALSLALGVVIARWRWPVWKLARTLVLVSGPTLAGYGVVMIAQRLATGVWDAFFLVQAKYGLGISSPFPRLLRLLYRGPECLYPADRPAAIAQTACVAMVLLAAVLVAVRRRAEGDRFLVALVLAHSAVFILVPPAMGDHISFYRTEAAVLPLMLLIAESPVLISALNVLFPAVAIEMGILYFKNILV